MSAPRDADGPPGPGRWRGGPGVALVPSDTGASRAFAAVLAILAFLAALAAGTAEMAAGAAEAWRSSVAAEATIQVRPAAGRDLARDLARAVALAARTDGVESARALSQAEIAALLEPWLGAGTDLAGLPAPGLVVLRLAPGGLADPAGLTARLAAELPGAILDDHGPWLRRLTGVTAGIVLAALGFVALVLAASGAAVAFATRGAMAGCRDVVDVLHLVGAADRFIAREFSRRFVRLSFAGGALGAAAAALVLALFSGLAPSLAAGPGAGEPSASWALGPLGYLAVALVAPALAGVAGLVSRVSVERFLKDAA